MRYLSVCSGIEAASVAWHPLGWQPIAFSEIEAFPSAVLAHHYPSVPNLGDMTKFAEWPDAAIDVLVGGTPCQSFSVAGLRKGLADPRGNLALTYLAIADRYRPEWMVWENVPGVLSSEGGRDFGAFLGGLGQLGYGWAYRVIDAQYCRVDGFPHAVPQRRRRVFVVGCAGDWRRAAAVLFERASLSGDSPPRRETGQRIAPTVIKGAAIGREPSAGPQFGEHLSDGTCYTLNATEQHAVVAPELCRHCRAYRGAGRVCTAYTHLECDCPKCQGFCECGRTADEDGTGRGTPIVPVVAPTLRSGGNATGGDRPYGTDVDTCDSLIAFDARQSDVIQYGNRAGPLDTDAFSQAVVLPINLQIATRHEALGRGTGFGIGEDGEPAFTLLKDHHHAVAFDMRGREDGSQFEGPHDTANIRAASGGSSRRYVAGWAVRRLTPVECERLQGFPDDYTAIPYRGKPAADGPRYKALGNSMACNVMRWLGRRIDLVQGIVSELEIAA